MIQREHLAELVGEAKIEVKVSALIRALTPPAEVIAVERAFITSAVPRIGASWNGEGGIYAGVIRGETEDYHLVVGAISPDKLEWGAYGTDVPGTVSEHDGRSNTLALIESDNDHPAAKWARANTADGHSDFYLPARRELSLLYANVPELFEKVWHWSSTQYSAHSAWYQYFVDGDQYGTAKGYVARAVAVRRLVL